MVGIGEAEIRVGYLLVGSVVLLLLRKPLRYPDRPGSRWVMLTVVALAAWLTGVGLYQFTASLAVSRVLFSIVMVAITLCFVGWLLVAVEFATGQRAAKRLVVGLAAVVCLHLILLVTNFFWVHELLYRSSSYIDASGTFVRDRGPLFWVHVVVVYVFVGVATALFVAEWLTSNGLRRRQAGALALAPVAGFLASALWYANIVPFPFDPTPLGATVGIAVLTWALYRTEFLELVPIGRAVAFNKLDDAVVILDDENRVVDWNPAATDRFGVGSAEVGTPAEEFFRSVPDETLDTFRDVTETQTELTLESNGQQRHFWVNIAPVGPPHSRGRTIIIRDITRLKRREQQLIEQNEYLDAFAEVVSHDLQGPLMGIRTSAELAHTTGDVSHLERTHEAVDRMNRLVENLLSLTRAGQQVTDTHPVALDAAATDAWKQIWTPEQTLVIETERTVIADPDRLRQLLENLFRHAVGRRQTVTEPNSGDASAVTVTVGSLTDGFYVADDGDSIPPEEQTQLPADERTATDSVAFGLGIASQIAGAHGWAVAVTDANCGGTQVEITDVEGANIKKTDVAETDVKKTNIEMRTAEETDG